MKGSIKITNRSGHTTLDFDTEQKSSVDAAWDSIVRELNTGKTAFDTTSTPPAQLHKKEITRKKLEKGEYEELLFVAPIAGG